MNSTEIANFEITNVRIVPFFNPRRYTNLDVWGLRVFILNYGKVGDFQVKFSAESGQSLKEIVLENFSKNI